MRLDITSRRAASIMLLAASLGFVGCSTLGRLPYNYMCEDPTSNCSHQECCHTCAVASTDEYGSPVVMRLTEPGQQDVLNPLSDIQSLREEFETLTEQTSTMQAQIVTLDKQLVEQRNERDDFLSLMQDVSSELKSVRQELSEYRFEVDRVAELLNRHQDSNRQILKTVEQQIDDVLSQYE